MTNITIGQFIVIDRDYQHLNNIKRNGDYRYTMSDQIVFVPGAYIPVIKIGVGCIGIARIERVVTGVSSTEIQFIGVEGGKGYEQLYSFYQLTKMNDSNSDDPYEDDSDDLMAPRNNNGLLNSSSADDDDVFPSARGKFARDRSGNNEPRTTRW